MSKTRTECRERRAWSAHEDRLLLEAVNKEDPGNAFPSRWSAIATHIPNRTNKDCRKRWFAHFSTDIVKGAWTPDEDNKLIEGMERYGPKWSKIAAVVKTRNSDQCAKRWKDTLDPAIDRTNWSTEADETLMRAVQEHGRLWTKIANLYFPGKTGLAAKNRYNSLIALARKTRNPSAYSVQPFYANAAPSTSSSEGFTSSMPLTPSIPISDLLSDTSYIDRSQCSTSSNTSSSKGTHVSIHTRVPYSGMVQQSDSISSNSHSDTTSSDHTLNGTYPLSGSTNNCISPYLDPNCNPFNPLASTSTNQDPYFDLNSQAPSPTFESETESDPFSMQTCNDLINTMSILSSSPRTPPSDSRISSPTSVHSKARSPTSSSVSSSASSVSSSASSSSSVSTSMFDTYNGVDPFRRSSPQCSDRHSMMSSPLMASSSNSSLHDLHADKTKIVDKSTREDLLLHIETLEALHQELSDQEQSLKSQRSSLNRVANAYRRQGDDTGARQYEQEAIKRRIKLNFVFEQQEGVDAQIAMLRKKLGSGYEDCS